MKGFEKGFEKGKKDEKINIARNMKLSKIPDKVIASITNLSMKEIKDIF